MYEDFRFCFNYFLLLGLFMYVIGLFLPRHLFGDGSKGHFAPYTRERDGKLYERLGVKRWKDKLPDMSKLSRRLARKSIPDTPTPESLLSLIQETCVAEVIHELLMVLGFLCYLIRRRRRVFLLACLWALGNLPFVIIQRYNRPRLMRLRTRLLRQHPAPTHEAEASPLSKGSPT